MSWLLEQQFVQCARMWRHAYPAQQVEPVCLERSFNASVFPALLVCSISHPLGVVAVQEAHHMLV
jgi:hypothetical protein